MISDIKGSNKIGRWFLGSVVESFLNSGFNLAMWQSVGKNECFTERLHISVIGYFGTIFTPTFKTFPERLSIPAALSIFVSFSNCSTRSPVTLENLNLEGRRPKISW